ncbi:MAG TPA: hypothetical protein VFQ79_11845 [Bryobacteraceae bacterium]|nr:hypothetical protein [Bryobacteraceae bacterium]
MADESWEVKNGHPPAGVLLLYLEAELEGRLAAAVERHTRACWTCRAQCERMERGIRSFVDFHETAEIPPPPAGRRTFLSRLREQAPVATSGAGGGWNAGNSVVYGVPLTPHLDTTSLAVAALRFHYHLPEVRQSLSWLLAAKCSSAYSLTWKILALRSYLDVRSDVGPRPVS